MKRLIGLFILGLISVAMFGGVASAAGDVCVSHDGVERVNTGDSECTSATGGTAVAINGSQAFGSTGGVAVAINNSFAIAQSGRVALALNESCADTATVGDPTVHENARARNGESVGFSCS